VWQDEKKDSIIIRGTKTEHSRDREVPKIPALRLLLKRMRLRRKRHGREISGRAFTITQCRQALETACSKVGVARLTHHSMRHLFATICIESGVDIPTVSRWLGHGDGGVLAMKTYGHLRQEHSLAQALKVKFRAI
jgi:integrase